ncbi:MAG: DUF4231 domain-containing protein [Thermodesulfobacteriota bacterium]
MTSSDTSAGNGAATPPGWDEPRRTDALERLHARVVKSADDAAGYYARGAASKRRWARWLRLAAIVLAAIGSVFPVLTGLIGGRDAIDATWASILLAGAATAVGLDRFFGFSSAWMRFITAKMQLEHLREQFDIDWQASVAAWEGRPPTKEQTLGSLAVLKKFLLEAHRIVRDETELWIREFQDSLQQVDVAAQAGGRSARGPATQPSHDAAPLTPSASPAARARQAADAATAPHEPAPA